MRSQAKDAKAKAGLKVVLADDDFATRAIDDFDAKKRPGQVR